MLALDLDPYRFACDGALWGVPHFWNVVTNLPYLVVGVWGLRFLARRRLLRHPAFRNWGGVWLWTALVCFGSGAYHWALEPWGLALDRIAICGLIAFLLAHVADVGLGLGPSVRLSAAFLGACQATVLVWILGGTAWTYGALQAFGGIAALVVLVRARGGGRLKTSLRPMVLFLACYALAKVVEVLDEPICDLTGFIGGHPLKHLVSAAGLAFLAGMMRAQERGAAGA